MLLFLCEAIACITLFRYISHLVGHEGPGSILHVLKEEGLATALSAGGSRVNTAFQMFSVTINVTEKGMKDVERVLQSHVGVLQTHVGVQVASYM